MNDKKNGGRVGVLVEGVDCTAVKTSITGKYPREHQTTFLHQLALALTAQNMPVVLLNVEPLVKQEALALPTDTQMGGPPHDAVEGMLGIDEDCAISGPMQNF